MGNPSIGSWVTYGLGSENENLPGFVVLLSGGKTPDAGKSLWGSGFLSGVYQGVQCRTTGDPVLYLSDPKGIDRTMRRKMLDAIAEMNNAEQNLSGDPETLARVSQYELAFRMQMAVPEVMDISQEPQHILDLYGAKPGFVSGAESAADPRTLYKGDDPTFANNCLLARRLVESGVRYVQLFDWGWDFHGTRDDSGIDEGLTTKCATMDRPVAALIEDLKQRGLFEETLIVCGGEFGRTPFREGRTAKSEILGRDHYPDAFTMWMAGGGVRGGFDFGATDELGFTVTENPVHVHDLQATILHLLGMDHEQLTYRFQGRDYRLTDVHGRVVDEILAT